jgi:putative endonuclease
MSPGPPYYVYVLTNRHRTVFYTGMTNNLRRRLQEHRDGKQGAFADCYNATDLLYFETHATPRAAIEREKQVKRWRREKKMGLIRSQNPELRSLSVPVD